MPVLHSARNIAFQTQPTLSSRDGCWLQILSHLSPRYGGIATSVPQLARATEAAGSQTCPVVGFCDREELEQLPENERSGVNLFPPNRIRWMLGTNLQKRLKEVVRAASGVHIHGVWEIHCMMTSGIAQSCKRPYVISAHGMLEPWALHHKRLKKALYGALVEIRGIRGASCLRALSSDEVTDYRRLGLTNPIAIIPGGTDAQPGAKPDLFRNTYPDIAGKRIVLFMGRVDPKKGLDMLLRAMPRTIGKTDDVHLVIAGPDSGNMRASLENLIDELRLRPFVTFTGMVSGELKWSALAAASLFVLPSFSEGFSIAVLEALAVGIPVIVTRPCHIPEVSAYGCGWVVEPDTSSIEAALAEFLVLSSKEADAIARRGRNLARTRFHSSVVGKQMAQVYEWLQGGNRPTSLEIA